MDRERFTAMTSYQVPRASSWKALLCADIATCFLEERTDDKLTCHKGGSLGMQRSCNGIRVSGSGGREGKELASHSRATIYACAGSLETDVLDPNKALPFETQCTYAVDHIQGSEQDVWSE